MLGYLHDAWESKHCSAIALGGEGGRVHADVQSLVDRFSDVVRGMAAQSLEVRLSHE